MSQSDPVDLTSDYSVKPSRIKLKTTKTETAEKIFKREQRRFQKEQSRISRANGYAVSPPRQTREESISPPRNRPRHPPAHYEDDDGGEWMGGLGRRAKEHHDTMEWEEKMRWMAGEENDPFADHPTYGYAGPSSGVHIPERWQHHSHHPRGPPPFGPPLPLYGLHERVSSFDLLFPKVIPPLGSMTETEYSNFIRDGIYAKKHASELHEQDRRRLEREERELKREKEREKRERDEARWRRRQEKEEYDRRRRRAEERGQQEKLHNPAYAGNNPTRWDARWAAIVDVGGDIEATDLRFEDIPWPVYSADPSAILEALSKDSVKSFLSAVSSGSSIDLKKVVREAIRKFHPDRFHSRTLPRVREDEQEKVKEGVEKVCRVLNDLVREV